MTEAESESTFDTEVDPEVDTEVDPEVGTEVDPEVGTEVDPEVGTAVDVVRVDRPSSSIRLSLAIALVIVALDQVTKNWAVNALSDGRSRHVIWTLHWNLTFNSGMAFSRAQGIGPYIGALALVVVIVLVVSLRRSKGMGSAVAVGLVVGGALGNLADRFFRDEGWLRGRVVDFIDLQWWPIFNIADMGVSIGGVLILLQAVFDSRTSQR